MAQSLYRLELTRPALLTMGPTREEPAVSVPAAPLERLARAGVVLLFGRTQTQTPERSGS